MPNQAVDVRGTDQSAGLTILKNLRDRAFDSSEEKLALGRPAGWRDRGLIGGEEIIDEDLVMKARGIAQERGVEL